jgi:protein phosphatase
MTGKSNEDRYSVSAFRLEDDDYTPSVFAIVADGIGGHRAGEIAAEIAVNTISHSISASTGSAPQETLEYAIIEAGKAIQSQSSKDDEKRGMGSTCACVWVIGDRLYTASVGDSRIYLLRNGDIRQITIDHTWVQEALEHGIIKPEQARNHPRSHIIRRYLGSKTTVVPDLRLKLSADEEDEQALANQGMQLLPGDQLLLCSDGLSDLVEETEMRTILDEHEMQAALSELVDLANERGGHDNITILALKMPASSDEQSFSLPSMPQQAALPWLTCTIVTIFAILIVTLGVAAVWYSTRPAPTPTPTPTPTLVTETPFPTRANTATVTPEEILPTETETVLPTQTPLPSETPVPATLTPWPTNPPSDTDGAEGVTPTAEEG